MSWTVDDLAVAVDAMQARGDVRGEWLARWLLPEGEDRDRALAEVSGAIVAEVCRRASKWSEPGSVLNHPIDFGRFRGLRASEGLHGKRVTSMVVDDAVEDKPSVEVVAEEVQAPVGVRARLSAETLRMLGGAR